MASEVIVPCRYILTKEEEIGVFAGVAYKTATGKRTELLWSTNSRLAVQIAGERNQEYVFAIHHVFVERYIHHCLDRAFHEVEIFRFYLTRGNYSERPIDSIGDLVTHFKDAENRDVWTTYEHISGPYLADPIFVTSQFSAGRLEDISPSVTKNLVWDKAQYLRNPEDLPQLGVMLGNDQVTIDQKNFEDGIIRSKPQKPPTIH